MRKELILLNKFNLLFFIKDFLFSVLPLKAFISFKFKVKFMLQHRNSVFGFHFISHKLLLQKLIFLFQITSFLFEFFFMLLDQLLDFLFIFFFFFQIFLLKFFFFQFIVIFQLHDGLLRSVASLNLVILSFLFVILEFHFKFFNTILKFAGFLFVFSRNFLLLRSF